MSSTIGNGNPVGICQPPGGAGPSSARRRSDRRGPPARGWRWRRRPRPARPGSRRRRCRTSAHIGRSGKPNRRRWRRPLMSRATIATQPTMPRIQVRVPADRALRPAADELEVRVQARHGGAAREVPDDAADGQQAAEGDDEGRHADVGDDEALERPDRRPRGRMPMAEGDDPAEREVGADARGRWASSRSSAGRRSWR